MLSNIQGDFPGYPINGSYLDSATKGLQPESSLKASYNFETSANYTVRKSLHKNARESENIYYSAKETYSQFLGTSTENIAWIPNSDIASNMIIHAFLDKSQSSKPTFVTSVFDHHSILSPLLYLKEKGKLDVLLIEMAEEPCIPEFLEYNLNENDIVMIGHTTQSLGLYREIESISTVCSEIGAYSVFDLSRTGGQKSINLEKLGVDIAFMDGSIDLLGPAGSGILYVKDGLIDELYNPFPSSGNVGQVTKFNIEQINNIDKFELGSPDIAGMAGLEKSIEYLSTLGIKNIEKHRTEIQNSLLNQIAEVETIKIIDPLNDKLYENGNRCSSVAIEGDFHPHDIALFLDETYNVQVRSGLVCSHPAVSELDLEELLQISTHVYTTKEDIERFVEGIQEIMLVMS